MAEFLKVAKTDEIAPGQARLVEVHGKRFALFNIDGNFYALDDTCTHRGGPLSEGTITGERVTCSWHGSTFDIRTGEVVDPPASQGVARYSVRVTGTDIEIEV
jgi:nitrite reductase/ring-hydroxylating ferredoxin subunit